MINSTATECQDVCTVDTLPTNHRTAAIQKLKNGKSHNIHNMKESENANVFYCNADAKTSSNADIFLTSPVCYTSNPPLLVQNENITYRSYIKMKRDDEEDEDEDNPRDRSVELLAIS